MPDGLHIATATGHGWIHGDGPGLKTRPGVMRRSTMDAGSITTTIGDGRLDRSMLARTTRPRWLRGSAARDGVLGLDSVVAMATDGARWASVSRSFLGTE